MSDGYALLEFNLEGECRLKDYSFFDIHFTCYDIEPDDIKDWLSGQLPSDLADVLVLTTFSYKTLKDYHYEYGWEYEDSFTLDSHTIVITNYKEFYKNQVIMDLDIVDAISEQDDDPYYKKLVASWEEFYDEDFVYESKLKRIKDFDELDVWELE